MTKTLNHIIFFFLHQNQNIFFSNIGNQNIFLEKNHNPSSFKLNGRSLNDLPDVVQNIVKLFADDTKLYAVVNEEEQQISLQNDIDSLLKWSDRWLLKFNKSKCKHIHLGPNTNIKNKMGESDIQQVTEEKRSKDNNRQA